MRFCTSIFVRVWFCDFNSEDIFRKKCVCECISDRAIRGCVSDSDEATQEDFSSCFLTLSCLQPLCAAARKAQIHYKWAHTRSQLTITPSIQSHALPHFGHTQACTPDTLAVFSVCSRLSASGCQRWRLLQLTPASSGSQQPPLLQLVRAISSARSLTLRIHLCVAQKAERDSFEQTFWLSAIPSEFNIKH